MPSSNYSNSSKEGATILKTIVETLEENGNGEAKDSGQERQANNTTTEVEEEEPRAPDLREILRAQIRKCNVSRVIHAQKSHAKQDRCLATVESGADIVF